MDFRQLHIVKGHTQQLLRHVEALYPLLKKETIEDFDLCIKAKLRELDEKIKNYKPLSSNQ